MNWITILGDTGFSGFKNKLAFVFGRASVAKSQSRALYFKLLKLHFRCRASPLFPYMHLAWEIAPFWLRRHCCKMSEGSKWYLPSYLTHNVSYSERTIHVRPIIMDILSKSWRLFGFLFLPRLFKVYSLLFVFDWAFIFIQISIAYMGFVFAHMFYLSPLSMTGYTIPFLIHTNKV